MPGRLALRGEFSDTAMMRDRARLASLFTPDGALRMPNIPAEMLGREEIRTGASDCARGLSQRVRLADGRVDDALHRGESLSDVVDAVLGSVGLQVVVSRRDI